MSTMILPEVLLAVQNDHGSGARARGALVAGQSGFSTAWRSAARPRSPLTIFFYTPPQSLMRRTTALAGRHRGANRFSSSRDDEPDGPARRAPGGPGARRRSKLE